MDTPIYFPGRAGTPCPEKPTSHMQGSMSDCPTDLTARGEHETGNHSPRYCGKYARCVPSGGWSEQSPGKSAMEKGESEGDEQGNCRKIASDQPSNPSV